MYLLRKVIWKNCCLKENDYGLDWISVEKELPQESCNFGGTGFSDEVLVVDKHGEYFVTNYVYPWRDLNLTGFKGV